ncbi:MAG: type pilus assembly protein PilB, partial [Actinomycetota bacterium]|nr:type pilus assembly protein PilB [Actinomycetota bacterium]
MRRSRTREAIAPVDSARLVPNVAAAGSRIRFGDLIVKAGAVDREAVEQTVLLSPEQRLGVALMDRGLLTEYDVTRALSEQLHIPIVDLRDAEPETRAIELLSAADAHEFDLLPLLLADGALTVAVSDPLDEGALELLVSLPVAEVRLALGIPTRLRNRVHQTYPALSAVATDIEAFRLSDVALEPVESTEAVVDPHAPIVQVVNKIVTQALRDRASDVHIEPAEDCVRVRFRIDGALKDVVELPAEMGPALVSRVKIMAEMNIVERRRPQDGQFEMKIDGRDL